MKTRAKRECRKIFVHICENLDEDLNSAKCRSIRKHIDGCGDCATYLESLKTTIALYKSYPVPPISSAAKSRLRQLSRPS